MRLLKKYYLKDNKIHGFKSNNPPASKMFIHVGTIQDVMEMGSRVVSDIKRFEKELSMESSNPTPPISDRPLIIVNKTNKLLKKHKELEILYRQLEIGRMH